MRKIFHCFLSIVLTSLMCQDGAAQVAINSTGNNPDTSAMLDIVSTNKGLLIPRVSLTTLTDASTIILPATSLLIYNYNSGLSTGTGLYYNSGTPAAPAWVKLVAHVSNAPIKTISAEGDTVALDRPPMGELSMTGNTTPTPILSAGVYYSVAGTTVFSSHSWGFSNGGVSNRLVYTGAREKMFHIACTISIICGQSNQTAKAVIYKNGSPLTTGVIQTKLGGSGDVTSTAIHVAIHLSTNDYLELRIMNVTGAYSFTITDMNLFALGMSMGRD